MAASPLVTPDISVMPEARRCVFIPVASRGSSQRNGYSRTSAKGPAKGYEVGALTIEARGGASLDSVFRAMLTGQHL